MDRLNPRFAHPSTTVPSESRQAGNGAAPSPLPHNNRPRPATIPGLEALAPHLPRGQGSGRPLPRTALENLGALLGRQPTMQQHHIPAGRAINQAPLPAAPTMAPPVPPGQSHAGDMIDELLLDDFTLRPPSTAEEQMIDELLLDDFTLRAPSTEAEQMINELLRNDFDLHLPSPAPAEADLGGLGTVSGSSTPASKATGGHAIPAEDQALITRLVDAALAGGSEPGTVKNYAWLLITLSEWLAQRGKPTLASAPKSPELDAQVQIFTKATGRRGTHAALVQLRRALSTPQRVGAMTIPPKKTHAAPAGDLALVNRFIATSKTNGMNRYTLSNTAGTLRAFGAWLAQQGKPGLASGSAATDLDAEARTYVNGGGDKRIHKALEHLRAFLPMPQTPGVATLRPPEMPGPAVEDQTLIARFVNTATAGGDIPATVNGHADNLRAFAARLAQQGKPSLTSSLNSQALDTELHTFLLGGGHPNTATALERLRAANGIFKRPGTMTAEGRQSHAVPNEDGRAGATSGHGTMAVQQRPGYTQAGMDKLLIDEFVKRAKAGASPTKGLTNYAGHLRAFSARLVAQGEPGLAVDPLSPHLDVALKAFVKDGGGHRSTSTALAHLRRAVVAPAEAGAITIGGRKKRPLPGEEPQQASAAGPAKHSRKP